VTRQNGPANANWVEHVVACAASAAVGLIGPGIRAMGCVLHPGEVELHFALISPTTEDLEDIEDIVFELDALLEGHTMIRTVLHQGEQKLDWSAVIPVFGLKPEWDDHR
jgi:hypothetical protein